MERPFQMVDEVIFFPKQPNYKESRWSFDELFFFQSNHIIEKDNGVSAFLLYILI